MRDFLQQTFLGNTILNYVWVLASILGAMTLLRWLKKFLFNGFERYRQKRPDNRHLKVVLLVLEKSILPLVYLLIIYSAVSTLTLSPRVSDFLRRIMMVLFTFFTIKIVIAIIRGVVLAYLNKKVDDENRVSEISGLLILVNLVLWSVGLMFLLGNMGYDITTIIAGLGIGGIAIALAAQAVLGDFFSYFVIFFDKPFEVGDFIQVDDFLGTIIHVGIKTTRIQNLVGEELVFSNTDLTNARLHNYNRMQQRRISFDFGVVKSAPMSRIRQIPELVKEVIEAHPTAKYNRGHFTAIEDSSFRFGFVYYVLDPDYTVYLDVQQHINLGILEVLENLGVRLAYPTRTLQMSAGLSSPSRERDPKS
ncbi:MAG TPA: mechanosensitive ion channel domain-containing protein [Arachidicoccus sp.]|nr:mechanosensitive ion channel domain-containing protein [Arachidicoccus sp.]